MIKFMKYGCVYLLIILIFSCRERFDEELPNSVVGSLVVDGVIDDSPGPYVVKLTRSVSFNSDNQVKVNNAEVYIIDGSNNRCNFKEISAGLYYSTSPNFKGKTGEVYTLFINTSDGLQYKSAACKIGSPGSLDGVFASLQSLRGLQINGDISFKSDQNISVKIDADIAIENVMDSICLYYSFIHFSPVCYEYHYITKYYILSHLNFSPVLKTNTDYTNGSTLKNIPLFYFKYPVPRIDSVVLDTANKIMYSYGLNFIIKINASTISNETYNFYNTLLTQISGSNAYFEPLPVQLQGNIQCVNDKTKTAFGLFQANAIANKYFKIENERLIELNEIPPKIFKDSLNIKYLDTK